MLPYGFDGLNGIELFCEADSLDLTDGENVETFTDQSSHERHLTASSDFPVFQTDEIEGKASIHWNGAQKPLANDAVFTVHCGWIIAKFGAFKFPDTSDGFKGLLTGSDNADILAGKANSTDFFDFSHQDYEFRSNDRIYLASAAPAPMREYRLIFFRFWRNIEMNGVQIGQQRDFTNRQWSGDIPLVILSSAGYCEKVIRERSAAIAAAYGLTLADVYPYTADRTGYTEQSAQEVNFYTPPEGVQISEALGNAKRKIDCDFTSRRNEEIKAMKLFHAAHYAPALPFIYRNYNCVPPEDIKVYFNSPYTLTGYLNNYAYSFGLIEAEAEIPATDVFNPEVVLISLSESPEGGFYEGEIEFTVEAVDDLEVDRIDIYIDGVLFETISGDAGSVTWDTAETSMTGETEIIEIKAIAVDDEANESDEFIINVPVQNTAPPVTIRLNCGDTSSGIWAADAYFDSGSSYSSGSVWATPLLPGRGASNDVYTKFRFKAGTIKYTLTGLNPSADALIRIHYGDQGFGFVQSINANGVEKVASYTLQTDAGGSTKVGIKEFTAAADGDGELVLDFIGGTTSAVSAIEVLQPVPAPYNMIHTCGDSTTAGGGPISETEAWFNQLGILLNGNVARLNNNSGNDFIGTYDETKKWTVHNMARSGDPIETQESLMTTYANPYLYDALLDKSIMFLSCGINNVLASESAATIQGKLTSFFAAVDSGFTTGIGTLTPSTLLTGGQETVRQAVNSWIRANSLGVDFIVDWEDDARLADASDTDYYYDGLHNTEDGHIVRAEIMRDVLEAL